MVNIWRKPQGIWGRSLFLSLLIFSPFSEEHWQWLRCKLFLEEFFHSPKYALTRLSAGRFFPNAEFHWHSLGTPNILHGQTRVIPKDIRF
jgi:hypothetical protein